MLKVTFRDLVKIKYKKEKMKMHLKSVRVCHSTLIYYINLEIHLSDCAL